MLFCIAFHSNYNITQVNNQRNYKMPLTQRESFGTAVVHKYVRTNIYTWRS